MIHRCYIEKRPGHDVAAQSLQNELRALLRLPDLSVRLFNRYDVQGLPAENWASVKASVLSQPMCDVCCNDELPQFESDVRLLFVEPLPGQFDIISDSYQQSIQMLLGGERPIVKTATVYALQGIDNQAFERIKVYLINPLDSREATADKPSSLTNDNNRAIDDIPVIEGFIALDKPALDALPEELGLAMSQADLAIIQEHFQREKRDPTLAELKVIDTYWSDHCRHTTFFTVIDDADIQDERVRKAYDLFLSVNGKRDTTLMNIATASMRHLRKQDKLPMLDESEENNACTVQVRAEFEDGEQDWLLFFKNETHNHPTEIEPYGGANTCVGGAIRDPLSGRSYVYQAMRITGSGDPRMPLDSTLPGKLPQYQITTTAAKGSGAYGNHVGLATGFSKELYHPGYIAKRLECGALVGAAPKDWVRREHPAVGDVVVLLGAKTGRDGIGGATGSSASDSSETQSGPTASDCAAEVPKGEASEGRKLQRLFRNPDVTHLIKRCNDFGAGGVSVAIGEIADGIEVNLDVVPTKYDGLNGMELALSESQERMAVVIAENDFEQLLAYANAENVEATVVAQVTERRYMTMTWRGKTIIDISRDLLDTNGATRYAAVEVGRGASDATQAAPGAQCAEGVTPYMLALAQDLNFCSQKGLVERFDSSVGGGSVLMPLGGKYALTEAQVMAALLPSVGAQTASVMAYGFDPELTEADPFGGSVWAVVVSVAKLIASGVPLDTVHLSLQEFFPQLRDCPTRWGKPFAAVLGAFAAQMGLGIAAIGGKDSMSGSFGELDVPSTLISFAVGVQNAAHIISPEFKAANNPVYLLETPLDSDGLPNYPALQELWAKYTKLCRAGKINSAWACERNGVYGGIMKMAFGNKIGFTGNFDKNLPEFGSIVFEATEKLDDFTLLGHTQDKPCLTLGDEDVALEELIEAWNAPLAQVWNVEIPNGSKSLPQTPAFTPKTPNSEFRIPNSKPKAIIPTFPGTNGEYDTQMAIERAGGQSEIVLVRNLTPAMLEESIAALEKAINNTQMLVFPGGFSSQYIEALFRNNRLVHAVEDLIHRRNGLILGISSGFRALVNLGLLPYGKVTDMAADSPTLTFNAIGHHQAYYVKARAASMLSPWMSRVDPNELYVQPISHGEGQFMATPQTLERLQNNCQIAFQYVDYDGTPSMDVAHNPNGSLWAIESICSPDGKILGKMAHTERYGKYVGKNVPGNKFLPLFEGGVNYFL